jgi:hypothetical protein
MSTVNFAFNGQIISVQCTKDEKMKEICQSFGSKTGVDINKYIYLNGGKLINFDSKLEELGQINGSPILVIDKLSKSDNNDAKSLVQSKDVICPKCQESCRLFIKNYKIKLANCKNGHRTNNILLDQYYNTQFINESNIKCGNNCPNSKSEAFNGKFYICNYCKINLCPLCYSKHDKNHKIINYDKRNYVCEKHKNELFISYCENCEMNLCMQCELEHNNHKQIPYKNIIPNKDEDENNLKHIKNKIDK